MRLRFASMIFLGPHLHAPYQGYQWVLAIAHTVHDILGDPREIGPISPKLRAAERRFWMGFLFSAIFYLFTMLEYASGWGGDANAAMTVVFATLAALTFLGGLSVRLATVEALRQEILELRLMRWLALVLAAFVCIHVVVSCSEFTRNFQGAVTDFSMDICYLGFLSWLLIPKPLIRFSMWRWRIPSRK